MSDGQPPIEMRLGTALGVLSQLFRSRLERLLDTVGLTYTQFELLNHLRRTGQASIGDVSQAMETNQPGITKVVQRLARQGLVSVEIDHADARKRLVALTPLGVERHAQATKILGSDLTAWFEDWAPRELTDFTEQAERLVKWLDRNRL